MNRPSSCHAPLADAGGPDGNVWFTDQGNPDRSGSEPHWLQAPAGGRLLLGPPRVAARDALSVPPALAGGPIAGLIVYLAHSPLDWDWEMPAVTLIALVLAGAVVGLAELARPAGTRRRAGARGSSGRDQTAIGA